MLIALCDDELIFCKKLKTQIYSYSNLHNIDSVVETFHSGTELLQANKQFDIIFLDYQMPGIDGLQTANLFKKKNKSCIIIFLTSYPEIVFDTFEYDTFRFLTKPLKTDKLYEALDSYRKKHDIHHPISVNFSGNIYKIHTKNIIYVEADGKNSILRLSNESLHCPKTLAKVFSLLPKEGFFKTHRSYIVNYSYIDKYDKHSIKFINGEYAKISRDVYCDFKKSFNIFLKDYCI